MDALKLEHMLDELSSDMEDGDSERRYTNKLYGLIDAMEKNEVDGYIEILNGRVSAAKTEEDRRLYGRLLRIAHILHKKTKGSETQNADDRANCI